MSDILLEILQIDCFFDFVNLRKAGLIRIKRTKSVFADKEVVEQGLGHLFIILRGSHFFN